MGPVHLSLLSTKAAQAQEGFLVDRAHNSDPTAQLPYRTRVATHPDHLEQPCGAQPGMLAQRLLDEFLVRVDRARARRWRAAWGVRQRSLHRFRMQPQLGRDRPHLPVFGVVKLANPGRPGRRRSCVPPSGSTIPPRPHTTQAGPGWSNGRLRRRPTPPAGTSGAPTGSSRVDTSTDPGEPGSVTNCSARRRRYSR